jgi:hypothetical protein
MRIRQKTVTFMRQHQEDFEPYMEDDEPFDRYCKRMAEVCMQGSWSRMQAFNSA